jgi:hypothetical protein
VMKPSFVQTRNARVLLHILDWSKPSYPARYRDVGHSAGNLLCVRHAPNRQAIHRDLPAQGSLRQGGWVEAVLFSKRNGNARVIPSNQTVELQYLHFGGLSDRCQNNVVNRVRNRCVARFYEVL